MLFEQGRYCRLALALERSELRPCSQDVQLFCEAGEHCREVPDACRSDRVHFTNLLWISIQLNQLPSCCQGWIPRSEEHTSELQSQSKLVCRLLLEKKKNQNSHVYNKPREQHHRKTSRKSRSNTTPHLRTAKTTNSLQHSPTSSDLL